MRKVVLNAEELQVESFDTVDEAEGRGTVDGQAWTGPAGYTCQPMTCQPPSCPAFSCVSQCPHGCLDTEWDCTEVYLDGFCV